MTGELRVPAEGPSTTTERTAMQDECVICGEGDCDAEMFNPETDEHGTTHADCGIAAGWDIS